MTVAEPEAVPPLPSVTVAVQVTVSEGEAIEGVRSVHGAAHHIGVDCPLIDGCQRAPIDI